LKKGSEEGWGVSRRMDLPKGNRRKKIVLSKMEQRLWRRALLHALFVKLGKERGWLIKIGQYLPIEQKSGSRPRKQSA